MRYSRTVAFVFLLLVAGTIAHCGSLSNRVNTSNVPATEATEHQASSTFAFVVEFSNTGLEARCEKGCAWRELTYSCGSGETPCRVRIDEHGVIGVARAGTTPPEVLAPRGSETTR